MLNVSAIIIAFIAFIFFIVLSVVGPLVVCAFYAHVKNQFAATFLACGILGFQPAWQIGRNGDGQHFAVIAYGLTPGRLLECIEARTGSLARNDH